MRASRPLAAISLAILLTSGLAGPSYTRAHPARALPPGGYIFAGMDDGQLYRSADGGATWLEVDHGLPSGVGTIPCLAVGQDGATVYAGTDTAGLWVSTDDGATWQRANGSGDRAIPSNADVTGVAIDARDAQHLFAVAYVGSFYTSTDGGRTWSSVSLPQHPVVALALVPGRPATLLAGTDAHGVLVSTDGGVSWSQAPGVPGDIDIRALAFDPRHPDLVYATAEDGLYRSGDGGRSWQGLAIPNVQVQSVAVDTSGLAGVLVGPLYETTIARSRDGMHWTAIPTPLSGEEAVTAFAFDPARPARVLAATWSRDGSRMLVSTDSGGSWKAIAGSGTIDAGVYVFATTPHIPRPSDLVDPPSDLVHARYFPATAHTLREPFLSFWDRHGNLALFGAPLTQPFVESGRTVQYFERARLSYSGGQATVDPLGLAVTADRHFAASTSTASASRRYFPSTSHTVAAPFLTYWERQEGSLVIGPPISEPLREQNGDGTGRTYLVQYFRNMRLEYHPELAGTPDAVQPGLLGRLVLHQRGWILSAMTEDQTRSCAEVLLPIWERWTDGNPALRRFLECTSADPASHEQRLYVHIQTTGDRRRLGGESPGVRAALLAAACCMKSYVGVREPNWWEAVNRACAVDRAAIGPQAGSAAPGEAEECP